MEQDSLTNLEAKTVKKKNLKLEFIDNEVYLEGKKLLPRQAYKRRKILEILLTYALKDKLAGKNPPTLLSDKDFINLLNLPREDDLNGHLFKPLRYLASHLDGALIAMKNGSMKTYYLNLENTNIAIK